MSVSASSLKVRVAAVVRCERVMVRGFSDFFVIMAPSVSSIIISKEGYSLGGRTMWKGVGSVSDKVTPSPQSNSMKVPIDDVKIISGTESKVYATSALPATIIGSSASFLG